MKQLKLWIPFVLIGAFFWALIVFREEMLQYISESRIGQISIIEKQTIESSIDAKYNYQENGESFDYTFLEFGSKGCAACKQMEEVMQEIKHLYPTRVKVVFVNLMEKENRPLSEYFGIVTIPTQVLLDNKGQAFFRHSGFIPANELSKHFDDIKFM